MRRFVTVLTLFSCSFVAADDEARLTYLFEIPIEQTSTDLDLNAQTLQVVLHVVDPDIAKSVIEDSGALTVTQQSTDQLQLEVATRATIAGAPQAQHLAQSFVLDYEEDAVVALIQTLHEQHDNRPSIDDLVQFVFEYIDNKNYVGTFELASKVAETRSGDCTEHAVLLAALARAFGYPSRLVFGVVIHEDADNLGAYGHAWTEIHNGDDWLLTDATLPIEPEQAPELLYLPFTDLRDEGPGYVLDVMRSTALSPRKISGLGPVTRD